MTGGTAVIIARTYPEAAEAAHNLKIQDWIFPEHDMALLGYWVHTVVYVERWRESAIITTATLEDLALRVSGSTEERHTLLTSSFLGGELAAEHAQLVLDRERLDRRRPPAPFVAPEAWQRPVAHARPTLWQRFLVWLR